jgi:hypothetical protein
MRACLRHQGPEQRFPESAVGCGTVQHGWGKFVSTANLIPFERGGKDGSVRRYRTRR